MKFGADIRRRYRDAMSQSKRSAPDSPQLELFAHDRGAGADEPSGLSLAAALASVSPGWWQHVSPLFSSRANLLVHRCEELDGELLVEATARDGSPVEWMLRIFRDAAARTCGACGGSPASLDRVSVGGPTRRVCWSCAERLRAGEEYLAIADRFWTLRESRRASLTVPVPPSGIGPGAQSSRIRLGEALPPEELRGLVADIRRCMRAEVVGQDDAVGRLALLAALHVGGGLSRGGRALLLGPSGVGKTSLVGALRRALEPFAVPFAAVDCIDLTSPGWSGAPSVGDVVQRALGDLPVDGAAARHAVIILYELHHITRAPETTGNMQAKRQEVLSSLLGLTGHGTIRFEEGTEWSSRNALVIGVGAFTDMLDLSRPVTIRGLTKAGLPLEPATRMAEDVIVLRRLRERAGRAATQLAGARNPERGVHAPRVHGPGGRRSLRAGGSGGHARPRWVHAEDGWELARRGGPPGADGGARRPRNPGDRGHAGFPRHLPWSCAPRLGPRGASLELRGPARPLGGIRGITR